MMTGTTRRYLSFDGGNAASEALNLWWRGLENRKGDRAELRRAGSLAEIAFVPAYHTLFRNLQDLGPVDKRALAAVAGAASHVRIDDPGRTVAARMASPKPGGDRARLSGLRFRRLLTIPDEDLETLRTQMIRVIRLLDGTMNLTDLANSVYWWNERTRTRWAFDYYEHAPRNEA